ncbi:MAG: PLP-dependent aminotransferase family protein [Rhizobacter sp.]|nr:PLP-dependent aminotransferase family protein [Chlorobiales bacterium]
MALPAKKITVAPAVLEPLLYEQVAEKIERLIETEVLRAGDRVPSVRQMSGEQRVSVSTVFQAYFLLENKGLIEARPQSGFYVRRPLQALPPETVQRSMPAGKATTVEVGDLVAEFYASARNPKLVPLGTASASLALLPVKRLNRALHRATKNSAAVMDYAMPAGSEVLRRQIARRAMTWGGLLSADDVLITNGCLDAINLCLRAVAKPGDTIAVESPVYYGILQAIESLGMKALEVSTYPQQGVCIEELEHLLKKHPVKACLFITNFSNPQGSLMPDEKKKYLVEMLAGRGIPLIEDDVYGDLAFDAARPKAAKAFDKEGLVLLCSSFSKTLAPGYRVGWVAAGRFAAQVERLKFMTTVTTAVLPQLAIAEVLESGGYDRHLRGLRHAFASQVQLATEAVCKYFPAGTKVSRPKGGFVLWVELPKKVRSLELYRKALAEKISIAPGVVFSAQRKYENFIRLSCGSQWSEKTERAMQTLGKLAAEQF